MSNVTNPRSLLSLGPVKSSTFFLRENNTTQDHYLSHTHYINYGSY